MRVVLDTNVVVPGIFWSGTAESILALWGERRFELLISLAVFDEYKKVCEKLSGKYGLQESEMILHNIFLGASLFAPSNIAIPSCRDPNDAMFLELAIDAKANYLVSGDKDLLDVGGYPGGRIIKPSEFLSLLS